MGTREDGERGGRKGLNRITRNCGVSRCAWQTFSDIAKVLGTRKREGGGNKTNKTCPFSAARCMGVLLSSFLASILTLARSSILPLSRFPIYIIYNIMGHMTG